MKLYAFITAAFIGGLVAAGAPALAADSATPSLPTRHASAVSAADLYRLYRGKTWVWSDGAGFFGPDGHFSAQAGPYSARGMWWVNYQGGVCFDAEWRGEGWVKPVLSCFSHSQDGEAWYQKREPSGTWWIFKSWPPRADDEVMKLKAGNFVPRAPAKANLAMNAVTP